MFKLICIALFCFTAFAELPLTLTSATLNDPFFKGPPSKYMGSYVINYPNGKKYVFATNHSALVLNMSSIPVARQQFDYLVVKYYEPTCHYCIRYSPNFYDASQKLRQTNLKVQFGQVDLIANPGVRAEFGVPVCPMVQLFTRYDMGVHNFTGVYNEAGLIKWVETIMAGMPNSLKSAD